MKKLSNISLRSFLIYLFLFVTFAFPKAGVAIGGTAITLQMILLAIVVILGFKNVHLFKKNNLTICYIYYVYTAFIMLSMFLNFFSFKQFEYLASIILLLSPLSILIVYDLDKQKVGKIIALSLCIVGGFSILQYIVGVDKGMIPGITYAYGGTYSDKPIGYNVVTGTALKMPSTYQNGNGSGIFLSLGILFLIKNFSRKNELLYLCSIIFGGVGLFFCGSRSVLFGFFISNIFALFLWVIKNDIFHKKYNKQKFIYVSCSVSIMFVILIYLILNNAKTITTFWDQMILRTLSDKSGNGRMPQLINIFNAFFESFNEPFEFVRNGLFGFPWNNKIFGEGFFGFFSTYGLITMIIFYFSLLYCSFKSCKYSYIYFAGLLTIFIDFMVDSTYSYLPYLCIFSLFYGFAIKFSNSKKVVKL